MEMNIPSLKVGYKLANDSYNSECVNKTLTKSACTSVCESRLLALKN